MIGGNSSDRIFIKENEKIEKKVKILVHGEGTSFYFEFIPTNKRFSN